MMGFASNTNIGPIKCFNPAKNYQLGWYSLQTEDYDPSEVFEDDSITTSTFVMNGIQEYDPDPNSDNTNNNKLIVLRLKNDGKNDYVSSILWYIYIHHENRSVCFHLYSYLTFTRFCFVLFVLIPHVFCGHVFFFFSAHSFFVL